jgi:outer membrane protein OmpA-like peptidoglycan-associated protein
MPKKSSLLLVAALSLALVESLAQAPPIVSTRWGLLLGGNFNMAGIGYAKWVTDPNRPIGQFNQDYYNDGQGGGLYGGLSFQTSLTDGLHFGTRVTYDNRSLLATDEKSVIKGDGVASAEAVRYYNDDYQFNMSYVSIEPHFKFYVGDNFHVTAGVGLGAAIEQKFDFTPEAGAQQLDVDVAAPGTVKHALTGSGFAGFGYDVFLSSPTSSSQWILTPFVEASYMVGQRGTNFTNQNAFNDAMSTVSIRGGVALAFGSAPEILESTREAPSPIPAPVPGKLFRATEPREGVYSKRIERADFPLRPYVFFDRGSTEIPQRYVSLTRDQTRTFALAASTTTIDVSDVDQRPTVQRGVYYNILNYMGWRLTSYPGASVELYSSDPDGGNARANAERVRDYLVNVWGVKPEQLKITTGDPEPRSGTNRTASPRLADENRRVQFRNMQPDRLGSRVMVTSVRPSETEHQMLIDLSAMRDLSSWGARIEGNGQRRTFGPFTQATTFLDPTGLLQPNQRSAKFTLTVDATSRDGQTRTESEQLTLVRTDQEGTSLRHRLIFEFNDDEPVARSKNFLVSDIIPEIRNGARVNIYGHTDEIGKANLELSMKRADQVMAMMKEELSARGIRNVRFTSNAVGEDEPLFANDTPEGRMYNRTVVIDVIP